MPGPSHLAKLLLLLGVVACSPTASSQVRGGAEKVFYFNMNGTSYSPITSKDIEGMYDLSSALKGKIGALVKAIESDKSPSNHFDDGLVRLKIVRSGKPTILCNLIREVKIGKKTYKLSKSAFDQIHRMILDSLPDG